MVEPTTSQYIQVRNSSIHGTGVYAAIDIPKGATIIEYVGKKLTKEESDEVYEKQYEQHQKDPSTDGAVYIFELNEKWDVDGNVSWNTARYINHSCQPNAETENTGKKILIQASRKIKQGEEITYNYGYDIHNFEDHPCKCGSKNCIGYIADEDLWPRLKRRVLVKKVKKKVGKILNGAILLRLSR